MRCRFSNLTDFLFFLTTFVVTLLTAFSSLFVSWVLLAVVDEKRPMTMLLDTVSTSAAAELLKLCIRENQLEIYNLLNISSAYENTSCFGFIQFTSKTNWKLINYIVLNSFKNMKNKNFCAWLWTHLINIYVEIEKILS